MARINTSTSVKREFTHEGGRAAKAPTKLAELTRSVLACLLWEEEFYESGEEIASRIGKLVHENNPRDVAQLAILARNTFMLRHAPLLLVAHLASTVKGTSLVSDTLVQVIKRPDEMGEFLSIYAKVNGKGPNELKSIMTKQIKLGLKRVFLTFDEYQLGKYNRKGAITLLDVMRLVHPKPLDDNQSRVFGNLVKGTLESPDTWEVALSTGEDKKETFTRLLTEGKLGYLALLRNLRGMIEAGVDVDLIKGAIEARKGASKVLPFRFVAAARHAPVLEASIDTAMIASIKDLPPLRGKTVILVDHSGSMDYRLSSRSDLTRFDAAATLGAICPSEDTRVFTFSNKVEEVPVRLGMGGIDAIRYSMGWGGTYLKEAIEYVNKAVPDYDRIIVVTDEQSHDGCAPPLPGSKAYMINVASNANGVGYPSSGGWVNITGFSENIFKFIESYERSL